MKKTKKGFTLVELVIVVAVMAVLVAVAIPTVSAITDSAKDSVAKTNAQTIESMLKLYDAEHEFMTNASGQIEKDENGKNKEFEWTEDTVKKAINEAKLGITDSATAFVFDTDKGTVKVKTTETASSTTIIITFGTDGTATADATP